MKRHLMLPLTLGACGCLLGGCYVSDASRLAGFSNPSVKVTKNIFGLSAQVGTNFMGKAEWAKDGTFKIEVNSAPEGVIGAEAARAKELIPLRTLEFDYQVAMQKQIGENINNFTELVTMALVTGSTELAATIAGAAVPILQGSRIEATLPGGLGGSVNLGAAPPAGSEVTSAPGGVQPGVPTP